MRDLLGLVLLFFVVDTLAAHQVVRPSMQTTTNEAVAHEESLVHALSWYPKFWAPLYPSVLWVLARAHLPYAHANTVFYVAILALTASYLRRYVGRSAALLAVILLAVLEGPSWNLPQRMAETLFTLESVLLLVVLARDVEQPSLGKIALAAALTALSALTRYFGFFWPAAPLGLAILLGPQPWRTKALRAVVAGAVCVAITAPWLFFLHATTGHWSGSVRDQTQQVGMTGRPNDFSTSARWTGKTLLIDFLSLTRVTRLGVAMNEPVSRGEWAMLVFVAPSLVAAAVGLARRRPAGTSPPLWAGPGALPATFTVTYYVVLLAVWSTTNNDPINSRFLYPSYPFLVMAAFVAAPSAGARRRDRLPYLHLYGVALAASVVRQAALLLSTPVKP